MLLVMEDNVEYQNKPVYKAVVPSEAIKETMKLCDEYDMNFYFEANDYIYIRDRENIHHQEFAQRWGMKDETLVDEFNPDEVETYIGMIVVNSKDDIPVHG